MDQRASTMADVAEMCRVSIQTVSAVVNGRAGISAETQQRVRAALDALDYHPNQHARTLRGSRNPIVGVLIPSITNPFFPELVRGIEDVARQSGYGVFLCNADLDETKTLTYLNFIRGNRASGLIATRSPASEQHGGQVEERLGELIRRDIPVVLFGGANHALRAASVVVDCGDAIRQATDHLIRLGHRRVGLIAPPDGLTVRVERIAAFSAAFAAAGCPLDPNLVVSGGFDLQDGSVAAERLMRSSAPPTAIVAANDLVAMGAIARLQAMRLRVPEDISVVGFDDIAFAKVFQPPITTVAQPIYEIGASAMRAILAMSDPAQAKTLDLPRTITLHARFNVRSSTGPSGAGRKLTKKERTREDIRNEDTVAS